MARFKFDYIKIGKKKRPIIPITLKYKKEIIETLALIDSGADFNIFHLGLAEALGIKDNLNNKIQFKGIGNKALELTGHMAVVKLMIIEGGKRHEFEAPVIFTDELPENGHALLGEVGFFDSINEVSFLYKKGDIVVDVDIK